ncbi:uncharacterized protein MELLADRAFT_114228 [Melampsora larici-populina 98AG31]|uniref:Uncharacterized protein n=1 Tax=Melampsora larici-populina (strain 98AG31 / pathotype 3-4-7) TaxID=747676 RepID=F4RMU6_MELLP|nr:uncharacterized protein MELLADRAFT_106850 [Melampsora larici-populina 98AG31]XP_007419154.1 uncharacterized protein MELLADRAFT_114228 [Melampsora larici-populina 98AG31]EGF97571.1 hypothetical protein MELLADRAFT_114228 [Melampsora larici-populina 98AG31]EGG06173.1 hypothetical protein MELLADRAFT_106850 [Melampsora larici-populina 98AG31]
MESGNLLRSTISISTTDLDQTDGVWKNPTIRTRFGHQFVITKIMMKVGMASPWKDIGQTFHKLINQICKEGKYPANRDFLPRPRKTDSHALLLGMLERRKSVISKSSGEE